LITPGAYVALLTLWRRTQLSRAKTHLERLQAIFDAAVSAMVSSIREAGEPAELLGALDSILTGLRSDLGDAIQAGMVELAQVAADRETAVIALVGATIDKRLAATASKSYPGGTVKFGPLATRAVEATANKTYADGWKLSDRLYNLDQATRRVVANVIVSGTAEQVSSAKLIARLREAIAAAGKDNPRYQASRIAASEINTAHREAHLLASTFDDGALKPWILGIRWSLSVSHTGSDECDGYADDDTAGLGAGVYLPGDVPDSHPFCQCSTTTVLVENPDIGPICKDPDPSTETEEED
jgi:hypothetical protein